jgi:hypothetical protein
VKYDTRPDGEEDPESGHGFKEDWEEKEGFSK